MRRLSMKITPEHEGKDVNTLLRRELSLSGTSVRRAKNLPEGILLDGEEVFTNAKVRAGQILSVAVGDAGYSEQIQPVPGVLDILYEDEDVLVVNKDGHTPVHPSQGHHGDTLGNVLMWYYREQGLVAAFHPVNRLDRGTSGLMAVAKHAHAHELLQQQMQDGRLSRTYLAVCEGVPVPDTGVIDAPIAREPDSVLKRMVSPEGAAARTHYRVLQTGNHRSLVELRLETGRTHQIRVHMAYLSCPLTGDFLYGRETEELPDRFALHSASIRFFQPITGEEIALQAPLPAEFLGLLTEPRQEEIP